jgi:hypothetical protein
MRPPHVALPTRMCRNLIDLRFRHIGAARGLSLAPRCVVLHLRVRVPAMSMYQQGSLCLPTPLFRLAQVLMSMQPLYRYGTHGW